jgi:predicted nucleotidyltransferase
VQIEEITRTVFVDGVPQFPEHYLMDIYRPELIHYNLHGPLEVAEQFFDRISLRTFESDHRIEVSGKPAAEALILVSHAERSGVDLPKDEGLLEELLEKYRADLKRLWNNLVKECRLEEPHRQAAIRLARRIWRQQGLPPGDF